MPGFETSHADCSSMSRAPAAIAAVLALIIALVVAGGMYLTWVRGDALFLDLAGLSGFLFCF